jgi:hypothetical protein
MVPIRHKKKKNEQQCGSKKKHYGTAATQEDSELLIDFSTLFWNKGNGQKLKQEDHWKASQSHYRFKQRLLFKSQEYPW